MKTIALLAAGAAALINSPPRPPATPATVALVAALPVSDARAAILRRAEPRADLVLLPANGASVEDLAAALALLAETLERDGPTPPTRDALLVVKSVQLARPLSPEQRLRLAAHLARLHAASPRTLDGVGTVPAIEVTVRTSR